MSARGTPLQCLSYSPPPWLEPASPPAPPIGPSDLRETSHELSSDFTFQRGRALNVGALIDILKPQFHARVDLHEIIDLPVTYHEYIKSAYIVPVLSVANLPRVGLPILKVLEKPSWTDTLRFDFELDSNAATDIVDVPPGEMSTALPLPIVVFLPPSSLDIGHWLAAVSMQKIPSVGGDIILEAVKIVNQRPGCQVCLTDTHAALVLEKDSGSESLIFRPIQDFQEHCLRISIATLILRSTYAVPRRRWFDEAGLHRPGRFLGALDNPSLPTVDTETALRLPNISSFDLYHASRSMEYVSLLERWMKASNGQFEENPSPKIGQTLRLQRDADPPSIPALFDPVPLPVETLEFMHSIQRKEQSVMVNGLRALSQSFDIEILEILPRVDPMDGRSYLCRVHGELAVQLPDMRLKVFDDRRAPYLGLEPGEVGYDDAEDWVKVQVLDRWADELVLREHSAFQRLRHAQGSFLPYYYGVYEITLENGCQYPCILTEAVAGEPVQLVGAQLSEQAKVDVVKGMRHFVRVLQYAEIQRSYWCLGDISVQETSGSTVTCTVMNLHRSPYSSPGGKVSPADVHGEVECLLKFALGKRLVEEHYGPIEDWDFYSLVGGNNQYVGEGWYPTDSEDYPEFVSRFPE